MTRKQFTGRLAPGEDLAVKVGKFTITARVEYDEAMSEPWKEHDGHGEVSDWTRRKKAPGERVLAEHRGSRRYYDFAGAVQIAKREGWDAYPFTGTRGQRAARAAEADYQRLRDWCNDRWYWVGVVLSVSKACIVLDHYAASLWGIESDAGEYLTEVANELLTQAVAAAEVALALVCA